MIKRSLILSACILFTGCHWKGQDKKNLSENTISNAVNIKYAKGFMINRKEYISEITVKNPWQNASQVEYTYLLSDSFTSSRVISGEKCMIRTPVQQVVCLSTTHIGFIDLLGEIESVAGISGKDYIVNEKLQDKVNKELLPDVGYDENLNFEILIKLKPDVVFAYGVSGTITNTVRKLNELEIPVVLVAEYLEEEPLAKMEWIKFFSTFYQKEKEACQVFDSVCALYQQLSQLALNTEQKPKVLLGLPWHGVWYVSGGGSYIAQLINDAGGNYIWNQLDYKDSKPVSLEKVFEHALQADFWLNSGDATTKNDILSLDQRFNLLPSFINNKIYNNNNLLGSSGGNAFFESGVVEPHIILSDIIYILHPQLLPSHHLKYYRKLH
jgi:iron complex transport system substrate-binding protein